MLDAKKTEKNVSLDGVERAVIVSLSQCSEVLSVCAQSGPGILTRVAHTAVWEHLYSTSSRDGNRPYQSAVPVPYVFSLIVSFSQTGGTGRPSSYFRWGTGATARHDKEDSETQRGSDSVFYILSFES